MLNQQIKKTTTITLPDLGTSFSLYTLTVNYPHTRLQHCHSNAIFCNKPLVCQLQGVKRVLNSFVLLKHTTRYQVLWKSGN